MPGYIITKCEEHNIHIDIITYSEIKILKKKNLNLRLNVRLLIM